MSAPGAHFGLEVHTPLLSQRVDLGAPPLVGLSPLCVDQRIPVHPMQRRVERSHLHLNRATGEIGDRVLDTQPMRRPTVERAQDQQVQGSVNTVRARESRSTFEMIFYLYNLFI